MKTTTPNMIGWLEQPEHSGDAAGAGNFEIQVVFKVAERKSLPTDSDATEK